MFAIAYNHCYKCEKKTRIVYDTFRTTHLTSKPFKSYDKSEEEMSNLFPFFYHDKSFTTGEEYFMNHCEFCGAKQGDNFIYQVPLHGMIAEDPNGDPFILKLYNENDESQ